MFGSGSMIGMLGLGLGGELVPGSRLDPIFNLHFLLELSYILNR